MKEIGLAGPKKDHLFCAIHKANEIGGAQAERILNKPLKRIYTVVWTAIDSIAENFVFFSTATSYKI